MSVHTRTVCALALSLIAGALAGAQPTTGKDTDSRQFATGRLSLRIGPETTIPLTKAEGGDPSLGPSTHGGKPPVTINPLEVALPLGNVLEGDQPRAWLAGVLSGGSAPGASGALVVMNYDYKPTMELAFTGAQVAAFELGSLDGGSKERAELTVSLQPTTSSWNFKPVDEGAKPGIGQKQKAVSASSFRVTFGDLPAKRIAKVEGIGAHRVNGVWTPNRVRLSVSAADMQAYVTRLQETIEGKATSSKATPLTIELLEPNMKDVAAKLIGENARLVRATMDMGGEAGEGKRGQVEIVVDGWTLGK